MLVDEFPNAQPPTGILILSERLVAFGFVIWTMYETGVRPGGWVQVVDGVYMFVQVSFVCLIAVVCIGGFPHVRSLRMLERERFMRIPHDIPRGRQTLCRATEDGVAFYCCMSA